MKIKFLLLLLFTTTVAEAQYFQRVFNFDYVTPKLRDEVLNSGIRSRMNFTGGSSNYSDIGIGVSRLNSALASPYNRADWLRFIRVGKTGSTVNNNRGIEYRDFDNNKQYNATGNSIAEVNDNAGTGGYIAVGAVSDNTITGATVPGGSDALYTVLSTTGTVTGAFRIDFGNSSDIAWCVRASAFVSNTWIVCGEATYSPAGVIPYTNCFVARLDNLGNIVWCSTYNFDPTPGGNLPTANNVARQLAEDPATGNIYVVGYLKDFTGSNGTDGLAFKLNSGGGFLNALLYNLGSDDEFQAVRWTSDGNIIVGGFTNFTTAGVPFYDMLLLKISPAGIIAFQKILKVQSGGATFESKCYDLLERKNSGMQAQAEYFLFGPKYDPNGIHQVVYKTSNLGIGINSYTYNLQKFDNGYGIDFANNSFTKPGLILFSSVTNSALNFSDSHMMKTYFNGAACTDYCPADPPATAGQDVNPLNPSPFISQNCTITNIKWKNYTFKSVLNCNQASIGCGSNAKESEENNGLAFSADEVSIYPNPADNFLNITWYNPGEGKNEWQILDAQGRILISQSENLPEGIITRQLDLSKLAGGYYIVKVTNTKSEHRKVLIRE